MSTKEDSYLCQGSFKQSFKRWRGSMPELWGILVLFRPWHCPLLHQYLQSLWPMWFSIPIHIRPTRRKGTSFKDIPWGWQMAFPSFASYLPEHRHLIKPQDRWMIVYTHSRGWGICMRVSLSLPGTPECDSQPVPTVTGTPGTPVRDSQPVTTVTGTPRDIEEEILVDGFRDFSPWSLVPFTGGLWQSRTSQREHVALESCSPHGNQTAERGSGRDQNQNVPSSKAHYLLPTTSPLLRIAH